MRRKQLDIPGFNRYVVNINPIRIEDTCSGIDIKRHKRRRGHDTVHLYDNDGKRRSLSIVTVLALAWHGQQPRGYVAHCYGHYTPAAIQWIPRRQAQGLRRGLPVEQRARIYELYFENGLTQAEIAQQLGCSQSAVCRTINRKHRRYDMEAANG